MDQIGTDPSVFSPFRTNPASQDFETSFNPFDISAIDDFILPRPLRLTTVEAVVQGAGGTAPQNQNLFTGNITAYRVEIYSSPTAAAAGLTGDVFSTIVPFQQAQVQTGYAAGDPRTGLVRIPISTPALAPGLYWLGVVPVMEFGAGFGQTGVMFQQDNPGSPGNFNGRNANPGGGFAFQNNLFIWVVDGRGINLGYRLTAAPPCPGSGPPACGPGDWNQDGVIDFNDVLAFLNDFTAQTPCSDVTGDGVTDFNDFLEFLNRFNAGC
jgi:hypothetical protein